MSAKATPLSAETYAYLSHVAPSLLRPYLKEVMQKSTTPATKNKAFTKIALKLSRT